MGRQTKDTTVLYSSIALLQERFRQLQKIKEMREEKELLKMSAEAERPSHSPHCKQSKCFFHPELIPSRPLHDSSSLQLDCYGDHSEIQAFETSLSIGLWPNKSMHTSKNFNEMDVDTTLHL